MSAAGKPEMTFEAALKSLYLDCPPQKQISGAPPVVTIGNIDKVRAAHARDLAAAFKRGQEEMREAAVEALWERVGREEYGHAKAAVTLDIEAVRAIPLREPR